MPTFAPPALPKSVAIKEIRQRTPRVFSVVLDDRIDCQPGQFVMLWIPRLDEKPFSADITDPLTITFAVYGPFTEALSQLTTGDKIGWRGPFGKGFRITGQRVLVVAGGVGLASVSNLIRSLRQQNIETHVIAGARTSEELYDIAEMEAIGCQVFPSTDDGTAGFAGFTPQLTEQLLQEHSYDQVYSCGPEVMMVKLRDLLDAQQVPYQFSLERYMKCAISICDLCSIDGQLCCTDGPVFDQDQLKKMPEFGTVYRITTGEEVAAIGGH